MIFQKNEKKIFDAVFTQSDVYLKLVNLSQLVLEVPELKPRYSSTLLVWITFRILDYRILRCVNHILTVISTPIKPIDRF